MNKEVVCIVCPMGCHIKVKKDENLYLGYTVEGNKCKRGKEYGIKELTNPTRIITTTVKIKNSHLRRLPVKTNEPVAKDKIFECMKVINKVSIKAPIKVGDVVLENILDTGVDIVASRSM
ncbi:MAG: DUF1667 domain-containing protein [Firmicutes bacterium]|nr:DUF1667 domain-containing protein [Bacillota bacterium]